MNLLLKATVIFMLIGFSKAHKLLLLLIVAVAGLYMMHTLAHDYQVITKPHKPKFFSKRSVDSESRNISYNQVFDF